MITIAPIGAADLAQRVGELADILVDCVEGGASVSFMAPLAREKAERFWEGVGDAVRAGRAELIAALDAAGSAIGTAQLLDAAAENQPHRADVAKVLVRRDARRAGVGEALMRAIEERARARGKTLLVLDTVTGEAGERLYARLGWVAVGSIPDYALFPDGHPCSTTFFYKVLS